MKHDKAATLVARGVSLALVLAGGGCHDLDTIVGPGERCQAGQILVGEFCMAEPPTCASAPRTCGPNKNDSCCAYDLVATNLDANAGTFDRSWDHSDNPKQGDVMITGFQMKGAATATVSPFYLDRYEVTVGRFRQMFAVWDAWVRDNPLPGAGTNPKNAKEAWKDSFKNPETFATQRTALHDAIAACGSKVLDDPMDTDDLEPMTCINWFEAYLFCIFDGGRLPTEAEWNFAATGGSQQRAYPWSPLDGDGIITGDDYANVGAPAGEVRLDEVGSFPKGVGRYGQFDLAGNAIEFVFDRCGTCDVYQTQGETDPVEVDFTGGSNVIARGGSFRFGWPNARTAYRQRLAADVDGRFTDTGWRCARDVQ